MFRFVLFVVDIVLRCFWYNGFCRSCPW